jgi:hypothetical protein
MSKTATTDMTTNEEGPTDMISHDATTGRLWLRVALALGVTLLACASIALAASAARAAGPQWVLNPGRYPTNASPGGTVHFIADPINEGSAVSTGTTTITYTLPPGFTATSMSGSGWTCTLATLTCTTDLTFPAGMAAWGVPLEQVDLFATVAPDAPSGRLSYVTLSGGGASPVTIAEPITVSDMPAPFGLSRFSTSVVDENGEDMTQAGGHPYRATASFGFATHARSDGKSLTSEYPRGVVADLPPGFIGNPQVVGQCQSVAQLSAKTCPEDSLVGNVSFEFSRPTQPTASPGQTQGLYNLRPERGAAAQFGFWEANTVTVLTASVRSDGDYGLTVGTPAVPQSPGTTSLSLSFCGYGVAMGGTFITPTFACKAPAAGVRPFLSNPTDCSGPIPTTDLTINSWENPDVTKTASYTSPALTGCDQLKFQPTVAISPTSTRADQPTGLGVHIHIPQAEELDEPGTPPLRDSVVTLPAGMAVNPSLAEGLQGCTDAQYAEHDGKASSCPQSSKIGSLEVTTPLLDHKLPGSLYIRQPDPGATRADGLYTLFLEVDDPQSGVVVKLRGSVVPDATTGQLTATFKDNPQLPFSDLDLQFKGGPNGALINSGACGPQTTQAQFTPWAGASSQPVATTSTFTTEGCGAGGFAPGFEAGTSDTGAGHYSPFTLRVTRRDGEQNVSTIDAVLPVGLTAKLAGVPLCGDAEAATGDCPASSQIGTTTVGVGAGSNLLYVPQSGKAPTGVYLAGPYKGDPYSLVVKVPAQAGPFDLGTVAVRSAIHVDPETAQVSVHSDPLPQILEGVPIAYRDIRVAVDRPGFTLNPTSCNKMGVGGRIGSVAGTAADVSSPFQVGGCEGLGFAPKLALRLKGATGHTGHPALSATVTYPQGGGYANIARAQVNLPHGEFLDQGNLNKTCTKPVLMAGACPASSIYGHAKAWTPLLDQPLQGPVYLVGGYGYKLPALVAELNGQLRVLLVGKVDSGPNRGIRNTFEVVPDAPVEKFELRMKGGKKYGLLENSENLCTAKKAKRRAIARFTGQNGRVKQYKPLVANECGKGKKAKKKTKKSAAHSRTR